MNVFIITTKMNTEFKDGSFSNWNENSVNLYGFKTIEEAQKEIETLREIELSKYKEWLHKSKGIFMHHHYSIENVPILENWY